jgi:hypothetical protein
MVMCQLIEGEKSVSEQREAIGLSPSAMSQHRATLGEHGIAETRREGQSVFYRIVSAYATALMATLHQRFCNAAATTRNLGTRRWFPPPEELPTVVLTARHWQALCHWPACRPIGAFTGMPRRSTGGGRFVSCRGCQAREPGDHVNVKRPSRNSLRQASAMT